MGPPWAADRPPPGSWYGGASGPGGARASIVGGSAHGLSRKERYAHIDMIDDGYGSREAGMTGPGFGSPPWGPVDPAGGYGDGVQGESGPGESRPRWADGADETAVDAFTPIPRVAGP